MQKTHDVMPVFWPSVLPWGRRQWLIAVLALPQQAKAQASARIKIAAASNLKFVLADLTSQYRQQTGVQVEVSLGASGNLARQILQGLPVEQFISADEDRVLELVKAGRTLDAGQRYATGRLALILPKNSALPLAQGLAAVVRALKPGDKLALANPALAPYGMAAQEALLRSGAGPLQAGQKVLGDNIGQATQFVATGAAQAGITALALAIAPELAPALQALPLPESLHAPLHQRMVLLQGASPAAMAWHRFLLSPPAQAIFLRHGYALPQ
ncbi:molybdate ABC transporter substrate-binding protein [Limnohabitans parvus II-B4]|uniref:Molybdate ABC transporter substrate-binding protein n=2 Tax=Limnohabitans TaxID=665874 RepID=A0A315EEL5_9BURK|nr:molybdate ABC transporter substrate-binding protein [Limnohabitans parvus II-B4]